MRLIGLAITSLLVLNVVSTAQTQNSAAARLVVDGVDGAPPLVARPDRGETLTIEVHGPSGRPFVLAVGADVQDGLQFIGPGLSIDIGPLPSIAILMSGLDSPSLNPFNIFANTGASGNAAFALPISPSAPMGLVGGLQAFVVDFTSPIPVVPSAAVRLLVGDGVPDILAAEQAVSTGPYDCTVYRSPVESEIVAGLVGLEFLDLGLQRFGAFTANEETALSNNPNLANSPGAIDRNVPPTPSEPRWFGNAELFPFVRSVHGDIYLARDTLAQTSGFVRVQGSHAERVPSSFIPSPAASAAPWHRLLNFDDGTLCAVEQNATGTPVKIHLFKIDGSTFAATGTSAVDITPVSDDTPLQVFPESVSIAGGAVWFVAATASSAGKVFRGALDGSAAAQDISLPAFSLSPPNFAGRAFPEIFVDTPRQRLFVKVSNAGGTTFGIVRIDGITPTGETTTLEPATVASQAVSDFGRAANGRTGRFAVSPSGNRVAWCSGNQPDLHTASLGDTSPLIVTSSVRFQSSLNTINDVHLWSESNVIFWLGGSSSTQDLYDFDISSGTVTNITGTNGQSGSVLPITSSPAAQLDASGQFRLGDKLVFYVAGLLQSGPFAGSFRIDLAGVTLPGLVRYNITGDLFAGTTRPSTQVLNEAQGVRFGANGTTAWFVGNDGFSGGGSNVNLYSFDAATTGLASSHLTNPSPSGLTPNLFDLRVAADGESCLAVQSGVNSQFGDRIVEAYASGGFQVVIPDSLATHWLSVQHLGAGTPTEAIVGTRVDGSVLTAPRSLVRFERSTASTSILHAIPGNGRMFVLGSDGP